MAVTIVSKLGSSGIFTDTVPISTPKALNKNFTAKYTDQTNKIKVRYDSLGVVYKGTPRSGELLTPAVAVL